MSWSKTATGKPHEVATALQDAILEAAKFAPDSPRGIRTAKLVADSTWKIITESADDQDRSWHPHGQREIVATSWGHINGDGALSHLSLSIAFVEPAPVLFEQEPATAPGADAATHAEVDQVMAGEPIFAGKDKRAEDQLTSADHALVEGKLPKKDRRA